MVKPSSSFSTFFSAVTILLNRCVKKAEISFYIAISASSFAGVQGSPTMLTAIFEFKLDVTCYKAGLSLVVWILRMLSRIHRTLSREEGITSDELQQRVKNIKHV